MLDDRLETITQFMPSGTEDLESEAKQAIYKDLMELLDDKQLSNFQIDIVREKIRAYCE